MATLISSSKLELLGVKYTMEISLIRGEEYEMKLSRKGANMKFPMTKAQVEMLSRNVFRHLGIEKQKVKWKPEKADILRYFKTKFEPVERAKIIRAMLKKDDEMIEQMAILEAETAETADKKKDKKEEK